MNSTRPKRKIAWELLLIILLALALRCWGARESLWLDELHTAWCVQEQWSDVAPRARIGNNSPLYFQLCWLLTRAGGSNEWALRGPSILAGLATVALVYWAVRRWTDNRTVAAVAALCAAVDSNFIFYSIEARPYALVQLLATAHLLLFIERLRRSSQQLLRIPFVVTGALIVYLHYTALLILVAEVCTVLILATTRKTRGREHLRLLCDLTIIGVICVLIVPHAYDVFGRRLDWTPVVGTPSWVELFKKWHGGWYVLPVVCVLALDALLTRFERGAKETRDNRIVWISLLFLWLISVSVCWLATRASIAPLMLNRYLITISAAPLLLAGTNLNYIRRLQIPAILMLVLVAVWQSGYHDILRGKQPTFMRGEDWRSLARQLDTPPAIPVLLRPGLLEADHLSSDSAGLFYDYCRLPLLSLYETKDEDRIFPLRNKSPRLVVAGVENALASSDRAWLILRTNRTKGTDLAKQIFEEPALSEFTVEAWMSFGQLQALRLRRRD